MKVLVKQCKREVTGSVVVIKDPGKKEEILRLLTSGKYTRAIKCLLSSGLGSEVLVTEGKNSSAAVDLVVTPKSMHWDLTGRD